MVREKKKKEMSGSNRVEGKSIGRKNSQRLKGQGLGKIPI